MCSLNGKTKRIVTFDCGRKRMSAYLFRTIYGDDIFALFSNLINANFETAGILHSP